MDYVGLLPTDYYPADVATVGGEVVVTNTRGIDARGPELTFDKGSGTVLGHRPQHAQHDRVADPLHAAGRPARSPKSTATVFAAERLDRART